MKKTKIGEIMANFRAKIKSESGNKNQMNIILEIPE